MEVRVNDEAQRRPRATELLSMTVRLGRPAQSGEASKGEESLVVRCHRSVSPVVCWAGIYVCAIRMYEPARLTIKRGA